MTLEQIKAKAWEEAVLNSPTPSFGSSLHEHGETEQEVMMSIDHRFRDEIFLSSMRLLNENRPPHKSDSQGIYFSEIYTALNDAGASVFIVCHDPWHANVSIGLSSYELTFCDVVKMEINMRGGVTMHASPDDITQLILLLQDIEVPYEQIMKESLIQYNCQKIMQTSAMHIIGDILEENAIDCSIHLSGKDRMKIMVYGKEPDNMDIFFTIETDLDNVRKDLLERLRRKIPPVLR